MTTPPITLDPDVLDQLRRLQTGNEELGVAVPFTAFGADREAPVVGRVGKAPDPVVLYRFPSRDNRELIRVLRSEASRWVNLTPGIPPSRRLSPIELRTADLQLPEALEAAAELLEVIALDRYRSAKVREVAGRGAQERRRQLKVLRRELAIDRLPGPTAEEAAGVADVIGHPPVNAP